MHSIWQCPVCEGYIKAHRTQHKVLCIHERSMPTLIKSLGKAEAAGMDHLAVECNRVGTEGA